jgi:ubiquinone/menaquinone biosynthesis C-methylase UbiE
MLPHENGANFYDFVFNNRFGHRLSQLTQSNIRDIQSRFPKGIKILDFGAGTGRLAIPLAEMGYQVFAVDQCSEMLQVLKEKAEAKNLVIPTSTTLDNFKHESFDLIISVFTVLHYITSEEVLHGYFRDFKDMLKPGGHYLFDLEKVEPYHYIYNSQNGLVTNRQNVLPDGDRINDLVKVSFSTPDKTLADYYEKVSGIYKGVPFGYEENFQLKFWTPKEVTGFLTTNLGFELVNTSNVLNATYFLFQKK